MIESTSVTSNIQQTKWGTANGKDIYLFTITNTQGSLFTFSNFGAAAQSLIIKDANGNKTDVLLGYDNLEDYKNDMFYVGTIVGRCANRIAGTSVMIGEDSFILTIKEGGFHHHGGTIGFNKKVWDVLAVDASSVKMFYKSADGEEGYPGNLEVTVTYTFDNNNNWVVEYSAVTDKETIINITQHAYFNLEGQESKSILDHELQIHSEKYLPVNNLQVPTGELAFVENTPFDFRYKARIGQQINSENEQLQLSHGYDHSWVLEEVHTEQLKHAASVFASKTGIELNVFTTEPAIHFYSGNFLSGAIGKNNSVYQERSGFCLETQHFPDAPNHAHFPSIVLSPDELFKSKTIFQFSVK